MKKGDLVKWKDPEHRTTEFKNKFGIIVGVGQLNHLGANKLPAGVFVLWPGKGTYWSPMTQLEVVSES
tara:strand:- start:285 stop:488 length:204 start_codon:yes stop_codon:yes gene_type:complete